MADNDQINAGATAGDAPDADRFHAPLARLIADVPAADAITRARHLRVAMTAHAAETVAARVEANNARQISAQRLRIYRTFGAVAAAALVIISFGIIVPLFSSTGSDDAEIMASQLSSEDLSSGPSAAPLTAVSEDEPSESRPLETRSEAALSATAPVQRAFNLSGLCSAEIEKLTYAEDTEDAEEGGGAGLSWVAFEGTEEGKPVIFVKSATDLQSLEMATEAAADTTEPPAVLLILDPATCDLLRVERAGP